MLFGLETEEPSGAPHIGNYLSAPILLFRTKNVKDPQIFFFFSSMIRRALLSVSDKTGIVPFAKFLSEHNVEILSTGGTAKLLKEEGIPVKDVSEVTQFPEMLDGRVKTLHPAIHGGILFVRGNGEHERTIAEHEIGPIDLVVVNLYPFEETIARGAEEAETIENIDIGGPSMVRSAAKNFEAVTVICDNKDFALVQKEIEENGGTTTRETRRMLSGKVFARTAAYDAAIAGYFNPLVFGKVETSPTELRYGENPHQKGFFYGPKLEVLQGKQMGYCNILDTDAAWNLVLDLPSPAVAIIKHATPCGVALGTHAKEAFEKAFAADSISAFGGIVACNDTVDEAAAEAMSQYFLEVIIAPEFSKEARAVFAKKTNLRLIVGKKTKAKEQFRPALGGILWQDANNALPDPNALQVLGKEVDPKTMQDLLFAWMVVKHAKSNAIVLVKDGITVGIGSGQTSRVLSSEIAVRHAEERAQGAVVASDAFFPFADSIEVFAAAGVQAIIQPGGSKRDEEVFAAAKKADITMVLTGTRCFTH